jgi:Methyltransferase domain
LVLASHGAEVTVADLYLAEWDAPFHRKFYEAFLDKWTGEKTAIEKALRQDGYDGLLTMVREPAEHMPSIKSETFDFVQSHATLEHIMDISAAAADMARVTRPHGFHSHQGDSVTTGTTMSSHFPISCLIAHHMDNSGPKPKAGWEPRNAHRSLSRRSLGISGYGNSR